MKAFAAIVKQTIRSAVRSHVFHVLGGLILLAVFLLPVTVSGDGTAMGQLQISLTYSLGVVVALISTTTLWLSCALLSKEIENYNLHMVTTKPCPRWLIWLAKWFGVFFMHIVILCISGAIILGLVLLKVRRGSFSEAELQRLHSEVMVGRRVFAPEYPDFDRLTEEEYKKRLPDLDKDHNPKTVRNEIKRQLIAKSGEVKPGRQKLWVFRHVTVKDPKEPLFFRYRCYAGSTSPSSQKEMPSYLIFKDPNSGPEDRYFPFQRKAFTGVFHEVPIDPAFVGEDGTLVVGYVNPPADAPEWGKVKPEAAMFQIADGPTMLVRVTGFSANYVRAILLAVFQIGFLAALGCMVGAAFSTPVAAFVAISYLVIGMTVRAAANAPLRDEFGKIVYKNTTEKVIHHFVQTVGFAVVSVDDLDATSDLARGRLIEWSRIGSNLTWLIIIRGGLIAAVGMFVLTRRELGVVIRR